MDERRASILSAIARIRLEGSLSMSRFARASAASGSAAEDTGVAVAEEEEEEQRSGGANTAGGGCPDGELNDSQSFAPDETFPADRGLPSPSGDRRAALPDAHAHAGLREGSA
jgi:hypothetical protein